MCIGVKVEVDTAFMNAARYMGTHLLLPSILVKFHGVVGEYNWGFGFRDAQYRR
jgi:hypothetical protein